MSQTINFNSQNFNVNVVNSRKKTKLMRGRVNGRIKDLKMLLAAIMGAGFIGLGIAGYNIAMNATNLSIKNNASEEFIKNKDHVKNEILSLYIEQALDDLSVDEDNALLYDDINDLYLDAEKAARVSREANVEQFELYKSAKRAATEKYQTAAEMLNNAGYVFGYGPYEAYKNAQVLKDGTVLFEVTASGRYGTLKIGEFEEGNHYQYYSLGINDDRRYIDAREKLYNDKQHEIIKK